MIFLILNLWKEKEEVKADIGIDEDKWDSPQNVDELFGDVELVCDDYDEYGVNFFKSCSKRKMKSMCDTFFYFARCCVDATRELKKSNLTKYRYIKKMLRPYKKSIKK